jgi:hypothetical protein
MTMTDKTAPDPNNLRAGWRTFVEIKRVERFLVDENRSPDIMVTVCEQWRDRIQHSHPEVAVLAGIWIFRGERLQPMTEQCQQTLLQLAEQLEQEISGLPENTKKLRLRDLLYYEMGIFFGVLGWFEKAADMHGRAAEVAELMGDKSAAVIDRFCQAAELLKNALLLGTPCRECLIGLERAFINMSEGLSGSPDHTKWVGGNGATFMLMAYTLLGAYSSTWNWLQTAVAFVARELGGPYILGAGFARALDKNRTNDPGTEESMWSVVDSDIGNEIKATAILVLMRRLVSQGKIQEAEAMMASMPVEDAQHIIAIAKRLIGK